MKNPYNGINRTNWMEWENEHNNGNYKLELSEEEEKLMMSLTPEQQKKYAKYLNNKTKTMERVQAELFEMQTGKPPIETYELIYNKQYQGSALWIRGNLNQYFATIGDSIITEKYDTPEEVEEILDKKDYNVIMNIICTIMDKLPNMKKEQEQQ